MCRRILRASVGRASQLIRAQWRARVALVVVGAMALPGCFRANPGFLQLDDEGTTWVDDDDDDDDDDDQGGDDDDDDVTVGGTDSGSSGSSGSSGVDSSGTNAEPETTGWSTGETSGDEPSETTSAGGDTGDVEPDPCELVPLEENECVEVELLGAPYLFCQKALDYGAAEAACEAYCGHLPVIESVEENTALHVTLLDTAFTPYDEFAVEPGQLLQGTFPPLSRWIGARIDFDNFPFQWKWNDGEPVEGGLWGPGEPDITGTCAAMAVWGAGDGNSRWFSRICEDAVPYRFVCELD